MHLEALLAWVQVHGKERKCGNKLLSKPKEAKSEISKMAGFSGRIRL